MARENRNEETTGGSDGAERYRSAPPTAPGAPGAADGRASVGDGGATASVPAQRAGGPTAPPPAPPFGAAPHLPPPPAPPRVTPPQTPPAVPSEDPSATGRSGGSRAKAPAVPPAAPRGRDTTDRPDDGRSPGQGDDREREARATGGGAAGPAGQLLDDAERDRLGQRLHHALAAFVDTPRDSVAEAAEVLAEAEQQLLASLRDRRAALRAGWQENGDPEGPGPDTEQLRLTLRTYREVTERLLRA